MSFGAESFDAMSNLIFSTERSFGGVLVGAFTQPGNGSATWVFDGSGAFPSIGSASVRAVQIGAGQHDFTVSGNAISFTRRSLAYAPRQYGTTLLVFAI